MKILAAFLYHFEPGIYLEVAVMSMIQVLIEHDRAFAEKVADRIYLVEG